MRCISDKKNTYIELTVANYLRSNGFHVIYRLRPIVIKSVKK